jgi:hypothetical protein
MLPVLADIDSFFSVFRHKNLEKINALPTQGFRGVATSPRAVL